VYHDKEGISRGKVRVRWWDVLKAARVNDLAMPLPFDGEGDASSEDQARLPNYGTDESPVFFGHYWLPAAGARKPLRHNIACLNSARLVKVRWRLIDGTESNAWRRRSFGFPTKFG